MGKSYSDKLKDPRWQRKRLEVMEAADFACENCGDSESTLNVHHGYYEWGREPWDYDLETLHCLCEPCHKLSDRSRKILALACGKLKTHEEKESTIAILTVIGNCNLRMREGFHSTLTEFSDKLECSIMGPGEAEFLRWLQEKIDEISAVAS